MNFLVGFLERAPLPIAECVPLFKERQNEASAFINHMELSLTKQQ
jgi:hypothetical protein